jgi:hypothetical protein
MVQLQLFGKFLDMEAKSALSVSIQSPFFSLDAITGSLSYEFSLPMTEKNSRLLGQLYEESNRATWPNSPITVFYFGTPWKDAILYVKSVTDKYNVYLTMDAGLLKQAVADKDLSQLALDAISLYDITSGASKPYIRLKLNSFISGDRKLVKLNVGRDVSGVPTITHQFQVFFDTDKNTTLNALAYQINNKNSDTHIWLWLSGRKYHIPSAWAPNSKGTLEAVYWTNKYWLVPAGQYLGTAYPDRIAKFISPDSYTQPLDPATHNTLGRINYTIPVTYSSVDEPIGNPSNPINLKATVFGDELLIEDLDNAFPWHLSTTIDFGPYWSLIASSVDPIIAGVEQSKIAALYEQTMNQTWPTAKFVCAPVRNESFLDPDANPEFQKYQNNIDKTFKLILNSNIAGSYNKNVFTCFPYVAHVLEGVFKLNDLSLYGSFLQDDELKTLCLWNNFSNDMVLVDEVNPLNQLRVPSPRIDLNQNLKGTSIKDFLYALRKKFGIDFVYRNNGSAEIIFKKDLANSIAVKDWSKYEVVGAEIYIEDDINGYTLKPSSDTDDYYSDQIKDLEGFTVKDDVISYAALLAIQDDEIDTLRGIVSDYIGTYASIFRCTYDTSFKKTWVFFGRRMKEVVVGDGENEIISELGVPLMYYIDEITTNRPRWRLPRVDSEGRTLFTVEERKDPAGLKFMFYRGMAAGEWNIGGGGVDIIETPHLSTIAQSMLFPAGAYDYSLNEVGEKGGIFGSVYDLEDRGTYSKFWKDWINLILSAKKMQKTWELPSSEIAALDVSIRIMSNGKQYLIEKADFEMSEKETVIITADVWRL